MADQYFSQHNVNSAQKQVERNNHNEFQGSLSSSNINHSGYTETNFVNPMHLANNHDESQYLSPGGRRQLQSVQVVIPSPYRASTAKAVSEGAPLSAAPPLDYQMLLLSLAEDYFAAAHGAGSVLALMRRQSDILEYQRLIAAGLSCLEATLKVCP